MTLQVCMTATLKCSFGALPSSLVVVPEGPPVLTSDLPAATIMDFVPVENIPTFGMCSCPDNPEVAAATTAAAGVLTPMPCVPVTTSPWIPGSPTVFINDQPALTNDCLCVCDWGGEITIELAGQETVETAGAGAAAEGAAAAQAAAAQAAAKANLKQATANLSPAQLAAAKASGQASGQSSGGD